MSKALIVFRLGLNHEKNVLKTVLDGTEEQYDTQPHAPRPQLSVLPSISIDLVRIVSPIVRKIIVYSRSKVPLATAAEKHLAGFKPAPGYPAARPTLEKLTRPRTHAVKKGPSFGPNTCFCRGSSPTPKASILFGISGYVFAIAGVGGLHVDEVEYCFNEESSTSRDDG